MFPFALLYVLSVSFRKIFILQLVGLVLTYDFTNCDFEKIKAAYLSTISKDLITYMSGVSEETFLKQMYFHQRSRHTHTLQFNFVGKKNNLEKIMAPHFVKNSYK